MTNFNYAAAKNVSLQRVTDGPNTFMQIKVQCADPGCDCEFCKRSPGKPLPVEALQKFVSRAGWKCDMKSGAFYCPAHS